MRRMSLPVIMDMRERRKERGVKINRAHSGNFLMNSPDFLTNILFSIPFNIMLKNVESLDRKAS